MKFWLFLLGIFSSPWIAKSSITDIPIAINNILIKAESSKEDERVYDSLYHSAIDMATLGGYTDVTAALIVKYFSSDESFSSASAPEFARQLEGLVAQSNNEKWLYHVHAIKSGIASAEGNSRESLNEAVRAFYYSSQVADPRLTIDALLLNGGCLEESNRKIEAFRNYMDALYSAETLRDNQLIFKCYEKLSLFYRMINKYERAKMYKLKQFQLLASMPVVDSVALMDLNIDLATILFLNNESRMAEQTLTRILDYGTRNKNAYFKETVFTIYRSTYISNGQFDELSKLYRKKYPGELDRTAVEDTTLYYRLMAFISEAEDKMDDASLYYSKSEERILREEHEPYFTANFYKRFGQFLLRKNDLAAAREKLETSLKYAESVAYLPYMIEITTLLDTANVLLHRYDEAHRYAKLNDSYRDELTSVTKEEDILRLEIDNEARKRELYEAQQQEDTKRRYNLQYMGLTIGIIISFIVLTSFGYFRVRRWIIKAMGFFAFIFFFEFIILLADHQIHHATHGEPWKIMALKIILIGILLPLHHWVEEKVVHYLSDHNKLQPPGFMLAWKRRHRTPDAVMPQEKPAEN